MIERQHLIIIREIKRRGSLTAAAEALNVSQPALSHMIGKLEKRHAIKIWTKKGRGLRLTPSGEYLLGLAERMLPELDHAEKVLAEISKGRRGLMRIGMECHPCQEWLMRVVTPYLAGWPDVDIQLLSSFRFDGIAALSSYEIDLLVTPDPMNIPGLHFTPIFDYELMLAVHSDHHLARAGTVRAEDLIGETLITVPVSVERLDIFTRFLLPARCRPAQHIHAESIEMMLQLVAAGRCITVLPDWFLREAAEDLPIKTLKIGPEGLYKNINLGIRADEHMVAHMAGFIQLARSIAP